MNVDVKRLEARKALLEKQLFTYTPSALLKKQVRYNLVDSRVQTMTSYIEVLQNRRIALAIGTEATSQPVKQAVFVARSLYTKKSVSKKRCTDVYTQMLRTKKSNVKKGYTDPTGHHLMGLLKQKRRSHPQSTVNSRQ